MNRKRSRGRPRGSGYDNRPYLAQVAELLIKDRSLTPTGAMKRVIALRRDWRASDASLLRRWQIKWKREQSGLLAAATGRVQSPSRSADAHSTLAPEAPLASFNSPAMQRISEQYRGLSEMLNSPAMQLMSEQYRGIGEMLNSPAMQRMADYLNTPAMQRITEEHRRISEMFKTAVFRNALALV